MLFQKGTSFLGVDFQSISCCQTTFKCIVDGRSQRPPCQATGRYKTRSRKIFTRKPSTLHHLKCINYPIYYMNHSSNFANLKIGPKIIQFEETPTENNPPQIKEPTSPSLPTNFTFASMISTFERRIEVAFR